MRISICVCTYNRANILPYCLDSLTKLDIPSGCEAEILIIDNNSADCTKDVVADYSRRSPIPMVYFHEPEQGLSAARNRAIREARGEYIGFLDDECVVRPDWIQLLVADINEFAPPIIGGPYIGALLPGTGPKWFKTEYGNAYFLAQRFERGYQKEFRASGGNILLHRKVFKTLQFDQSLGMKADELKLGEEISLQNRFLKENPGTMIFYEPRIEVAHYILPEKMSLSYHARRAMEAGASRKIEGAALALEAAWAFIHLCAFPFRALLRNKATHPYWQNYIYERLIPRVMPVIGSLLERRQRRYG